MPIGIIGAGQIGGTLTWLLTARGHSVRVANSRDPRTLAGLATETGAETFWAKDAAAGAEAVIVHGNLVTPRGVVVVKQRRPRAATPAEALRGRYDSGSPSACSTCRSAARSSDRARIR
jgi:3-hydroxyisobutyrate dehydrogenase-like beta-hydroxyacid dehydrogenase